MGIRVWLHLVIADLIPTMLSTLAARGNRGLVAQLRPAISAHGKIANSARAFWNVSLPVTGGPGGAQITKYHIVKPWKEGVKWDDFLIALPERDHLASTTK